MPRCCCFWLEKKDSNPHKQSQSLSCYPYTILQYPFCTAKRSRECFIIIAKLEGFVNTHF